ncbi:MAG: hypothetical protein D6744_08140 [Planctomycetota bacterium]|nr:MAG: hypothetical protein D6744_08140 [Planctomycetota bacterium]
MSTKEETIVLSWFDDEIRASLAQALADGDVCLCADPRELTDLLRARYPLEGDEPNWAALGQVQRIAADDLDRPGALAAFLDAWFAARDASDDAPLVYVACNLKNTAFELTPRALREHAEALFGYPQNAFVFPRTDDWILHSTRDDELIGGVLAE